MSLKNLKVKFRRISFLGEFENDIIIYSFGKGIVGLGSFLFIPLLTRNLGVEKYGTYSLILTFVILSYNFISGWIKQSILRFHTDYVSSDQLEPYFNTVKTITVFIATIGFFISSVGTFFLVNDIFLAFFSGLLCSLWICYNVVIGISQSLLKPKLVILSDVLRTALPFLLLLILVYATDIYFGVNHAFLILAIGLMAGLISQLWILKIDWNWSFLTHYKSSLFKKFIKYGMPISFWLSISTLQVFVGRYAMEFWGLNKQLGLYTAFQDVSVKAGTLAFIPVIYAIHPRIMAAWNNNDIKNCQSLFKKGIIYFLALSLAFLVAGFLLYSQLINLLFNKEELDIVLGLGSKGLFLLFILSEGLNQLSLVTHKGFEVSNKTSKMVMILLSCVVFNVFLLAFMVKPFGIYGVIFSLVISRFVYVIVTGSYSSRKFQSKKK